MVRNKLNSFLLKIHNFLFYCETTKDKFKLIQEDIFNYNRKCVIIYSAVAFEFFLVLTIITLFTNIIIAKNKYMYLITTFLFLTMMLLNSLLSKKCHVILEVSKYIYVISLLAAGIVLAVNSASDVTATYMVMLFAVPLLLMLRPFTIYLIIIISNVVYLLLMYRLEDSKLFRINLINALIYGILAMMGSASILIMKIQKYETDYVNRTMVRLDQLTGLLNRHAYNETINTYASKQMEEDLVCISIDINGLKSVNDSYRHSAGDNFITASALCMRKAFRKFGDIFRVGGDEFIALLHASEEQIKDAIDVLNREIAEHNKAEKDSLSVSLGYSLVKKENFQTIEELAHSADVKMYLDKQDYYRQTGKDRRK